MTMDAALTPIELKARLAAFPPPALVDVRRDGAFDADPELIPGAVRHRQEPDDAWAAGLEPWRSVVVYCVHGHEMSQGAAERLRARGFAARFLAGGIEGWRAAGNATTPYRPPTRWVTRERPKIDRIACPWLIRRFVDPSAVFFYVPNADVKRFAVANDAVPYDVPDVAYSHVGARCSFDAFVDRHALANPALDRLATIIRGADTAALELAPQAPGLLATSLGLSAMFGDDHAMLKWGMLVYDSLYAWCREAAGEVHGWNPDLLRQ